MKHIELWTDILREEAKPGWYTKRVWFYTRDLCTNGIRSAGYWGQPSGRVPRLLSRGTSTKLRNDTLTKIVRTLGTWRWEVAIG